MRKVYVEFSALHQVHDGTDLVWEFLDEAFDLDVEAPHSAGLTPRGKPIFPQAFEHRLDGFEQTESWARLADRALQGD